VTWCSQAESCSLPATVFQGVTGGSERAQTKCCATCGGIWPAGHATRENASWREDLVGRNGSSRAPVHEALIQLAAEGLFERRLHHGASIKSMTLEEVIEIAEVRRQIESLCAGRAALADAYERAGFVTVAVQVQVAAKSGDVRAYLDTNALFHEAISAMANHRMAERILGQFRNRPIGHQLPQVVRARPPMASVHEHQRIAAAIAAGDPDAASNPMLDHLTSLIEILQAYRSQVLFANDSAAEARATQRLARSPQGVIGRTLDPVPVVLGTAMAGERSESTISAAMNSRQSTGAVTGSSLWTSQRKCRQRPSANRCPTRGTESHQVSGSARAIPNPRDRTSSARS